ncbi:methionyl-tRNA formyltransferase [Nocardiopsis gilva]|uniref:methionyl-tRNA formyltransferase n=1 Tax=Nocardiopsis gilva TaxID=280236 RepID=UPI0013780522|nr:methionyl-tRNA formyltransferase [Nocardiopsis gilva]
MTRPARVVLLSEANSKFGAPLLADLLAHPDVEVVGLLTRSPGVLCSYYLDEPDPVDLAEQGARARIPVLRPKNVNDPEAITALNALEPDYLLIANFQQILREPVLALPRRAVINFHPSPLPRYAGLAPFFWMALNEEKDAGVTALITTPGVDEGPVLAQRPVRLNGTETSGEIRDRLFTESRSLLHDVVPRLATGELTAVPQDTRQRSYFSNPRPEDTVIDWSWTADRVMRVVRACAPQPGALIAMNGGEIRIHDARILSEARAPAPVAAPGTVGSDARHGLAISCADAWIEVVSLSWHPETVLTGHHQGLRVDHHLSPDLAGLLASRGE